MRPRYRFPLAETLKTMDPSRLAALETIDPRPLPPWRTEAFAEIEVNSDRETARERAETIRATSDLIVYSDASGRKGHLGAAIVTLNGSDEVIESQQVQVGPIDRWSVHVAELIGIFYAVNMVFKLFHQRSNAVNGVPVIATILCDSKSALQAIQNVKNKSGQRIVHAILQAATEVRGRTSDFASNGCQGTVKTQGTILQIDSPKKPHNRVKLTPFDRYYRGRTRLSAAKSMPSGDKSGGQAPKVLTYGR
jgi:hypothetical protein